MKNSATVFLAVIVLGLVMMLASPVMAQDKETHDAATSVQPVAAPLNLKAFGGALGAGLVVVGGGLGIGRVGSAAVEAMARQPEATGSINTAMIITAAMIEGATLFAVLGCFLACMA